MHVIFKLKCFLKLAKWSYILIITISTMVICTFTDADYFGQPPSYSETNEPLSFQPFEECLRPADRGQDTEPFAPPQPPSPDSDLEIEGLVEAKEAKVVGNSYQEPEDEEEGDLESPIVEYVVSEDEEGSRDEDSFDPVQGEASAVEIVDDIIAQAVSSLRTSQPDLVLEQEGSNGDEVNDDSLEDSDTEARRDHDDDKKGHPAQSPPKPPKKKSQSESSSEGN